jgi:hypothetical protein
MVVNDACLPTRLPNTRLLLRSVLSFAPLRRREKQALQSPFANISTPEHLANQSYEYGGPSTL